MVIVVNYRDGEYEIHESEIGTSTNSLSGAVEVYTINPEGKVIIPCDFLRNVTEIEMAMKEYKQLMQRSNEQVDNRK